MSSIDDFFLSRVNFFLLHGLEQDGGSRCRGRRGASKDFESVFLSIATQKGPLLAGTSGPCLEDSCKKTDVFPSQRAHQPRRLPDAPPRHVDTCHRRLVAPPAPCTPREVGARRCGSRTVILCFGKLACNWLYRPPGPSWMNGIVCCFLVKFTKLCSHAAF